MVTSYLTIGRDGAAEIEVQRSRFRCQLTRVTDEADARSAIEVVRRRHPEARHHCTAFVIGPDGALQHSNDDGEPSGTAGPPMLEVLKGREVCDVVAVVTRWFGGVLLGTGGLARAYADATRAALDEVGVAERVLQELCEVVVDIATAGRLEHELRARGARMLGVEYTDLAALRLAVPPAALEVTREIVAELTSGTAELVRLDQRWVTNPL